ncbi:MAG: glycosyltransferase, partial [Phycisphaerales bacterium]
GGAPGGGGVNEGSRAGGTGGACAACAGLGADGGGGGGGEGRVAVVHQDNAGLPAARNTGARAAVERGWLRDERGEGSGGWGEFVVFLDADDYLEPTFASSLARAIEADGGAGGSSHAYCQERLVDKAFGVWAVPEWDPVLLLVTNLHPVTALIRAEWFARVGGFDESMREGYEDWEFWIRLSSMGGRGVRVREPLFNWRRHSDVTMVIEAVSRHDELFGRITRKHASLYQRHALEVVRLSNMLLRRGDANWIDENHESIVLRDLRAANSDLWREFCRARQERDAAREGRARLAEELERKPAVKVSRRVHRWLDAMGPVGRGIKGAARAAARVLS